MTFTPESVSEPEFKPMEMETKCDGAGKIGQIERIYEMKDQNRADDWLEGKSRLVGFLKYHPSRKMKDDSYSKTRLTDKCIQNMKTGEEFVTQSSVDKKYKARVHKLVI